MSSAERPGPRERVTARRVEGRDAVDVGEWVATEEPLQLQLQADGATRDLAVTMRTPGDDFDLARGFLLTEGLVRGRRDIRAIRYCVPTDEDQHYNTVTVDLAASSLPDLGTLERYGTITSACGVCGKTTLDALTSRGAAPVSSELQVAPGVLRSLPARLRRSQDVFEDTGGLHAAAAFDTGGELVAVREDVGRHNALDKLLGWAVEAQRLPLSDAVVLLSGRASFELVQKAVMAGVPVVAAISAPSNLAVHTADRFGVTLVGFLRGDSMNVYTHPDRVVAD